MDTTTLEKSLIDKVMKILPHKSLTEAQSIVEYLFAEGVKKEMDLRRMTIDGLKTVCDTVDASDLFEDWQLQYGVRRDQSTQGASTSRTAGTSCSRGGEPLTIRNAPAVRPSSIPTFDKDSPYIPAAVRKAIEAKKRPSPSDRFAMVERIVDHVIEVVPDLKRPDFDIIADNLVQLYGESFKDTLPTSRLGSDSLRQQFKIRFDNLRRNPKKSNQIQSLATQPEAYGCLQWSPPLPSGESETSQLKRREALKTMFDNTRRHWDWRKIKAEMDASFYLLRKNINGPNASSKPPSKRRRLAEEDSDDCDDPPPQSDNERAMTVLEVKENWPCLFVANGMNFHMQFLTGSDFQQKLEDFLVHECKLLIDLLSSSQNKAQAKTRRLMLRAEARGNTEASLAAFLLMTIRNLNEDASALATFVEETLELEDVDVSCLPEDKTPHLVVAGTNLFDNSNIFLAIDGHMVTTVQSLRDAFCMLFSSYFIFGIAYPTTLASTLTYVQKAIANIEPEKGTKCKTNAVQKKANAKATLLHNKFKAFKDELEDEENIPTARS